MRRVLGIKLFCRRAVFGKERRRGGGAIRCTGNGRAGYVVVTRNEAIKNRERPVSCFSGGKLRHVCGVGDGR